MQEKIMIVDDEDLVSIPNHVFMDFYYIFAIVMRRMV